MKVIPPLTITDAMLTSSTVYETAPAAYVPETTYAANAKVSVAGAAGLITCYNSKAGSNTGNAPASSPTWWDNIGDTYQVHSGATYALGDRVLDTTTHHSYESLAGTNTSALTDATKWLDLGFDNRWAMFDAYRNTGTTVPLTMTVVITPFQRVDSIALLGLIANSATITVTSGGSTVYSVTENLNTRIVTNWYDYFFSPFATRGSVVYFDLPPYTNAVITITLAATAGNVSCGAVVMGLQVYLGEIQYNSTNDTLNFSTVTRDTFGNATMVPRRNIPQTSQDIFAEASRIDIIRALRDQQNAVPAVWSGMDDDNTSPFFEAFVILGFYRKFVIDTTSADYIKVSLQLEEI